MNEALWYSCTVDGSKEQETVDQKKALEILHNYLSKLKDKYLDADEAIFDSLFGFSQSKDTFIEISLDSKQKYRIKYESPVPKEILFLSYKGLFQKEYFIDSKSALEGIIERFFQDTPEQFKNYFNNLNYKICPRRI